MNTSAWQLSTTFQSFCVMLLIVRPLVFMICIIKSFSGLTISLIRFCSFFCPTWHILTLNILPVIHFRLTLPSSVQKLLLASMAVGVQMWRTTFVWGFHGAATAFGTGWETSVNIFFCPQRLLCLWNIRIHQSKFLKLCEQKKMICLVLQIYF